ncbi:unnamed protein product [Rotaria socialis]|uniref:Uncharacterized protein n=1 Tax=Rotaria socialis TaxID=392032 RepID=A0A817VUN3_9BILA|nr:unnamed protein product [Rotaria socialis]
MATATYSKCVINMAGTCMIELAKKVLPDVRLIEWFNSFISRWGDRLKIVTSMKLERIRSQSCTKEVIKPSTVITSSSHQPVACSNSIDKSFSNYNDLTLKAYPSTTRPSSCPKISLTAQTSTQYNMSLTTSKPPVNRLITTNQAGLDLVNASMMANTNNNQALASRSMYFNQNLYNDNMPTFASTPKHCVAPPLVTHLNANASNNSCEISSNDYFTLPSNQNDKLTTQTVFNAMTTAIDKYMSSMITSTNKRKRMVEGSSLRGKFDEC